MYPRVERTPSHKRTRGLTLIELMVALLIGLVITAGAIQIFISNKQAYRMTEALSRIQENGRFAMDFLAHDIRAADGWGCGGRSLEPRSTLNSSSDIDFGGDSITGQEAANAGDSLTDTLRIRGSQGGRFEIVDESMNNSGAQIKIPTDTNIEVGDILMITDCDAADVFQVTGPNNIASAGNLVHNTGGGGPSPGNSTKDLSKAYDTDTQIFQAVDVRYFTELVDGEPTLRRTENGTTEDLIRGVEALDFTYGISDDDSVESYVPADAVPDWDKVIAVNISLVLRSQEDRLTTQPQDYIVAPGASATTAADRRLYKVFNSVFKLRNRAMKGEWQ